MAGGGGSRGTVAPEQEIEGTMKLKLVTLEVDVSFRVRGWVRLEDGDQWVDRSAKALLQ